MKDRAAIARVGKAHFATEPVDDLLDDAEAKSGTALLPVVSGIGLSKFLEDERLEVDWDTRTVVAHRNADDVGFLLDRHHHFTIRRRKLDGVGKQIGDNLEQPVWIGSHIGSDTPVLEPNSHAIVFGEALIGVDRLPNNRSNVCAPEIEDNAPGFHLLDVENVVDEPHQALAVGMRNWKKARHRTRQVSGGG